MNIHGFDQFPKPLSARIHRRQTVPLFLLRKSLEEEIGVFGSYRGEKGLEVQARRRGSKAKSTLARPATRSVYLRAGVWVWEVTKMWATLGLGGRVASRLRMKQVFLGNVCSWSWAPPK